MAKSKVPAVILHHPIPEVRQLALVRWEACERCEDFIRVVLAILDNIRTHKSIPDSAGKKILPSLRAMFHSISCDSSLSGQDLGDLPHYCSALDVIQAAVDVKPAGGDIRDFIPPGALEAAYPKMAEDFKRALEARDPKTAEDFKRALEARDPKMAEDAKPILPAPALDSPAVQKWVREINADFPTLRKPMAEIATVVYDIKRNLVAVCSRPLSTPVVPSNPQLPSSAVAPPVSIPAGDRTIPMSYRKAAGFLGKGKSKDAAEWVSRCVADGTLRCEHISRQLHVFSRQQFPNEVWPRILPREQSDGKRT
jgi:hypothetical protein